MSGYFPDISMPSGPGSSLEFQWLHYLSEHNIVDGLDFPPGPGEPAASHIHPYVLDDCKQYLWVGVNSADPDDDPSTPEVGGSSGVVHLFTDDGGYCEYEVTSGGWYPAYTSAYTYNASAISDIQPDSNSDSVMVIYSYGTYPYNPNSGIDTTWLEPPASFEQPKQGIDDSSADLLTEDLGHRPFEFRLLENPAMNSIPYEALGNAGEEMTIKVFDISGRQVAGERLLFASGRVAGEIDLSSEPCGLLVVVSRCGDEMERRKITLLR